MTHRPAIAGLVTGAVVWGLIWYPLRELEAQGLVGSASTFFIYAVSTLVALALFARRLREARGALGALAAIGAVSGWTNLAYVISVIEGEVMRVMLLFYLAPLWTVLFARGLLGERQGRVGALVVLASLVGAVAMLWDPAQGLPLPANRAEWLGLSAGMAFALSNVLIRKATHVSIQVKSVAVFVGVSALALAWSLMASDRPLLPELDTPRWLLVGALGLLILATNLAVQYGLSHTSATQAIVILLFELVVAAVGAYFLAGEVMGVQEWVGGALIVTASLLSSRLAPAAAQPSPPVLAEEGSASSSTRG